MNWHIKTTVKLNFHDIWIGVYWEKLIWPISKDIRYTVYICFIPCAPIKITIENYL
jgi:hypothetical protein